MIPKKASVKWDFLFVITLSRRDFLRRQLDSRNVPSLPDSLY